jgi:DNA-binding response OmpR family regulator
MQILLVEDDAALGAGLAQALRARGYAVNHVSEGRVALTALQTEAPDIVVLDLGLPDMDGTGSCAGSAITTATWILLLTTRNTVDDLVEGSTAGPTTICQPFRCQARHAARAGAAPGHRTTVNRVSAGGYGAA